MIAFLFLGVVAFVAAAWLVVRDVILASRRQYHVPSGGQIVFHSLLIVLALALCVWLYAHSDYVGDDPADSDPVTEVRQ
jgi:hypothetical protein